MMKIYGVYKCLDMTEGRGPMILDTLWFDEDKAIAEIQERSGSLAGREIGDVVFYGGFWYIKPLRTEDEIWVGGCMTAKEIKIEYDGAYPNLCSGELKVIVKLGVPLLKKVWVFPSHCLRSGGSVSFDMEWNESVESGPWDIDAWPEGFPEELKQDTVDAVNAFIPYGCCGGCV